MIWIIIIILILVVILLNYKNLEGFYSNCMENVFGKITCFPPGYFPFFIADYVYPRYSFSFGPWVHGPAFRPINRRGTRSMNRFGRGRGTGRTRGRRIVLV